MDFRELAVAVIMCVIFVTGSALATDSKSPGAAGPVAFAKKVSLDKSGTLYLTMRADVPSGPGARRLGYTVWVQGKMLKYPKDQAYDGVFDPYFVIDPQGATGRFIFLLPLRLPEGESTVEVRSSEGGKVQDNDKNVLEWSKRRSASGLSALDWSNYNSNPYWDASTEWTFGPGKP